MGGNVGVIQMCVLPDSEIASQSSAIRIDFRHSRVHCDCIPFTPKTTFRVKYLTLLISVVVVWTGLRELLVTCAPTVRALNVTCESCELFSWFI